MTFYVIAGIAFFFSLLVQWRLKATYRKWGSIRNSAGITGGQTARTILDANNMRGVPVQATRGKLTDHYDPRSKTLRLSEGVYGVPSVAALAVAAHEAGHAIQDQVDYRPLELRSALAPVANVALRFGIPAAIFGSFMGTPALVQIGLLGYVGALLLQFLTLPVEFNASNRAMRQLEGLQLLSGDEEEEAARSVLRAAAMTYVAGAASAAGYIFYLLLLAGQFFIRKRSNKTGA
jgi:Zn-dependent membrane protease YugP